MKTRAPGALPLLWFGIYPPPVFLPVLPPSCGEPYHLREWELSAGKEEYEGAIAAIKEEIAEGETYQVNYTYRLRSAFYGCPWSFFRERAGGGPPQARAFLDAGCHVICSFSPEMFFTREGEKLSSRPMKGTAPRGRTTGEDEELARSLRASPKERAENLMILDMVRNDLGRVARPGSVRVAEAFAVERYPTLLQMTSTVEAATEAGIAEVFRALFPPASVTGAPKARTMEIISRLETAPRGIYTGCAGFIAPGRRARFSVTIRTLHIDRQAATAEYGTGGGVLWDSTAAGEYRETALKARVLSVPGPSFSLLETMRWSPLTGCRRLSLHLARLCDSASYFFFPFDRALVLSLLGKATNGLSPVDHRIRVLLDPQGGVRVEAAPFPPSRPRRAWKAAIAPGPVERTDPFLFHKTTRRNVYESARSSFPGHDDVLLWNREGEATESTVANLVVKLEGEWITPPLDSGLLPGVFRAALLARGRVREETITLEELRCAEKVFLVNSLRGFIPVELDRSTFPSGKT